MKDLQQQQPESPAIWLRVSRDGGRTYGPQVAVWLDENKTVPVNALVWPPCQCPQHRVDDAQEVSQ